MSIVIADDHPLILRGLKDFLIEKKFDVVHSANNGKDALKGIIKHEPEVAVLDIRMPLMDGIEVAKACSENNLDTKIVLITFEKDGSLFEKAKSLNVKGYILKEFALAEIEKCLEAVASGKIYFSPNLEEHLVDNAAPDISSLSPTETHVLKHVALNKTTKEIADEMFVSFRTVEKHRSNIIKKLGLPHHQNALLIWAKENQDFFV